MNSCCFATSVAKYLGQRLSMTGAVAAGMVLCLASLCGAAWAQAPEHQSPPQAPSESSKAPAKAKSTTAPRAASRSSAAQPKAAPGQGQARVLSAIPVVRQVGVPQQVCEDVTTYSIAPADANGQRTGPGRRCSTETVYEERTVGYDVTYEYAGRQHTTRMAQAPGRWLPVQTRPSGAYHSDGRPRSAGQSYGSEPAGSTVTESIIYEPPVSGVPVRIDINPF